MSGRFSEIITLTVRLGKTFNLDYNALLFLMSISFFAIWRMKFGKIDYKKRSDSENWKKNLNLFTV